MAYNSPVVILSDYGDEIPYPKLFELDMEIDYWYDRYAYNYHNPIRAFEYEQKGKELLKLYRRGFYSLRYISTGV